jgi:hypothetical protein
MHSKKQALEVVQLGDANVESYVLAMDKMVELGKMLKKTSSVRNCMGLEDRVKLSSSRDPVFNPMVTTFPAISEDRCSHL